jgi:hypothetical protein
MMTRRVALAFISPWLRSARRFALALAVAAALGPSSSLAQTPPSPIDPTLFSFPGSVAGTGAASTTALALADRWLGEDPFDNPAFVPRKSLTLSPVLLHTSRQDLRADNRHFDETTAFFDMAGGWADLGAKGVALALYAYQPLLRREANAFERGSVALPVAPAVVESDASMRELRAGLAASTTLGPARVGIAGEWTRRDDAYHYREQSGSPGAGDRTVDFAGNGFGGQVGARLDRTPAERFGFSIGVQARYVPEIQVDGSQKLDILTGLEENTVTATREAGWEGGLSARLALSTSFRVLAAWGGRTAQDWDGFGVTSGEATSWSLGGDFHDTRDPWTLRFGFGQERQADVPESRDGMFGLGLGWRFDQTMAEIGVLRRAVERPDQPTSFDDRVVATLVFRF